MDLVDVVRTTSIVYERKGVILRRTFIRTPFILSGGIVVHWMCRSSKLPRNVYDVMVSIFMSVVWSPIRFLRICVCFVVFTIGEWKRGVPLMFLDCFMMSIQVWMSGKRKLCLPVNYISFCMKIPNRNVYVVHKLLPPWCFSFVECHLLIWHIWKNQL